MRLCGLNMIKTLPVEAENQRWPIKYIWTSQKLFKKSQDFPYRKQERNENTEYVNGIIVQSFKTKPFYDDKVFKGRATPCRHV